MLKTKLTFSVFVSLYLFVSIVALVREEMFRSGLFQIEERKVLIGHVVSSHHVVSPLHCSFLCISNAQCLSYNYKPKGAGDKDVCELNNATRKSNPGSYQDDALYIHYYDGQVQDSKACLNCLRSGLTQNGTNDVKDKSGAYKHIGCFKDTTNRALPDYLGTFGKSTAIQKCAQLTKERGFTTFSVQYGGQCFTGATSSKTYDKYGQATNCANGLGGSWANDVYSFSG